MYKDKSIDILKVIIKFCYVALALVLFAFWFLATGDITLNGEKFKLIEEINAQLLVVPFTAVVPAGYAALICIDKLLTNIKNDLVFEKITLKYLDAICYACVYAAAVGIISTVVSIATNFYAYLMVFVIISLGELFMALVLKVIKQVFQKAIIIKEENELTI